MTARHIAFTWPSLTSRGPWYVLIWPLLGLLLAALGLQSCRPEDERIDPSPAQALFFGVDTVRFDTVFTEARTATRRLRLYNPNAQAIVIERIMIGGGGQSPFSMIVNGRRGSDIRGLTLLGRDSAFVLIEGRLGPGNQDRPLLIADSIEVFTRGRAGRDARVLIEAYGQDANYLPSQILPCNLLLEANRPHVFLGNVLVEEGCTLTVAPGARLHFSRGASLLVEGTLLMEGLPSRPIVATGTRLEPAYRRVPDQWGAIALLAPSRGNRIRYSIIENGLRGVQVGLPSDKVPVDVELTHVMIRNMSEVGVFSFGGEVVMANCVVADCGQFTIGAFKGGRYRLSHVTSAYSGNNNFDRRTESVVFADFYDDQGAGIRYIQAPLQVQVYNSLITGPNREEMLVAPPTGPSIDLDQIRANVIRSQSGRWTERGNFSQDRPFFFRRPFDYDLRPDSLSPSPARERAVNWLMIPNIGAGERQSLEVDYLSVVRPARDSAATSGAYEAPAP